MPDSRRHGDAACQIRSRVDDCRQDRQRALLRFRESVPAGWRTGETVAAEVPAPRAYWRAWPGMARDLP